MNQKPAYVSDELYAQVTATFPIVCIDAIPFDAATGKIGVIVRATGQEAGGLALVGGRIQKNETIEEAISRHLLTDLAIKNFTFYADNIASRPFYVQQYHQGDATSYKFSGFDPSKHAIGLTYIIEIKENASPRAEASDFQWISKLDIPATTAYNQGVVMHEAFDFIAKKKK